MREILFKAKDKETNEWIEGTPITAENGVTYIAKSVQFSVLLSGNAGPLCNTLAGDFYSVIPETVSQFNGLYDKNGVRIFENDIVIIGGNKSFPTMIEFLSGSWQCVRKYTDKGRENEYSYLHRLEYDNPNQYEVIGNRFDNPELLKWE